MSTPDRDAVIAALRDAAGPMTIDELAVATSIPRARVACAVHNAPRDTFKRAHGVRNVGNKDWPLFELGSREREAVATRGVWQI